MSAKSILWVGVALIVVGVHFHNDWIGWLYPTGALVVFFALRRLEER